MHGGSDHLAGATKKDLREKAKRLKLSVCLCSIVFCINKCCLRDSANVDQLLDEKQSNYYKTHYLSICSIWNKLTEIMEILLLDNLHILAISITHLDSTFEDAGLMIQGYRIFGKDRTACGDVVAFHIKNHICSENKGLICSIFSAFNSFVDERHLFLL